jgi:putative ABC transport system permease protein
MAHKTSAPPRRESRAMLPPAITLAAWRVRQTWRLLLVTGVGMLAGVVLVCTAPLFSQVTLTAGLRGVLTATPQASQLTLHAQARQLSTFVNAENNRALESFMQQHVGAYFSDPPDFSIQLAPLHVSPFAPGNQIQLTGASMQASAAHLHLIQGRLPQDSGDVVEIAVTPDSFDDLHVPIGMEYTTTIDFLGSTAPIEIPLTLRLVGTFLPIANDPFWQGQTFSPVPLGSNFTIYNALMSNAGFLVALTRGESQNPEADLLLNPPDIFWYYHLDVAHLKMADLDDLINRLNIAQLQLSQQFSDTSTLTGLQILGPPVEAFGNPSTLEKYRDRVSVVQIPIDIVAFQIFFLILFFISMMADILVDRQAVVIALLRSRGASRWQVFGSFVNQSVGLGLIALIAGPPLAILATRWLTQATLPPADQSALNILDGNPLQALGNVGWFALAAALGAVLAMIVAIRSSASRDVLEMRRQAARVTRPPLWQRIYLDIVAAIIALTGFAISLYVAHAGVGDSRTNILISTPLALIAPIFLVIAGVLFFLRLFPLLLRPAARLAARRPQAAPMLALAQMARAPRQAMRMVLLLALAISFGVFSLVFTASESQQILNVAASQVGADFSGQTPNYQVGASNVQQTLAQHTAAYRKIPGVLSATLGFAAVVTPTGSAAPVPLEIRAVDRQTFAQTAIWTDQDSTQTLPSLMSQLKGASATNGIPAIVDALTWRELHLSAGGYLRLNILDSVLTFVAVAQVQHIPTVNDSLDVPGTSDYSPRGGILVDIQTLADTYEISTANMLPLNYAWLRTSDDPALLAKIRAALTAGPLQMTTLNDRRAMIDDLQHDPLYLNLIAVLRLGAAVTVLLALVGNLIASWLGVRSRLLNFVVLRALGSSPRQIASVLIWEQSMIYTAALVLGVLFGTLLIGTIVPALVFVAAPNNGAGISSGEFYVIQHVLPVQIILPPSLGFVFAGIVAICVAALWMMARVVSRPAIGQTLRLSED